MPATDAVFSKVAILEETTYGTVPATAMQLVNVDAFPLMRNRQLGRPQTLTNDRRRFANRVLREDGSCTLAHPLQFRNMILLYEGLLANDESAAVTVGPAITIAFTATTITDSGNGLASYAKGDMIYVSGAGVAGNNGWKGPLTAVAAGTLTLPTGQVSTEAAGASVTIKTRRMIDGTTTKSYDAEIQWTQLTTEFRNAKGLRVSQGTFSWRQGEFARESFELMGKAPVVATATLGTGAATAAVTSNAMNAVQDFGKIWINNAETALIVSSWELQINSTLNAIYGLGSVGPQEITTGPIEASLRASVIWDDNASALLSNIDAQDSRDIWWYVVDLQGNRMAFQLLAVKADVMNPWTGAAGSLVEATDVTFSVHDTAKDSGAKYFTTTGLPMIGIYMAAA